MTAQPLDAAVPPTAQSAPVSRGWFSPLNPPLRDWTGLRVWLVGASSGIGRATAAALHARGAEVLLSARGAEALAEFVASHPSGPGRLGAQAWPLDVGDAEACAQTSAAIWAQGPVDVVLYCAGHYKEMRADQWDGADLRRHMEVNYMGALSVLGPAVAAMRARGRGHIGLVSSVAGFRGLPKSLAYGPTKAALTHLGEALYLDLQPQGLGVCVIHPGFVQTPLTAQNDFKMPALISPEKAAEAILLGLGRGEFDIHFPKRFTRVMHALRLLPYRAYFALVRRTTGL